jgi:N-acetyl-alpha-D-muramate 1-phosphate uridylyltransferase
MCQRPHAQPHGEKMFKPTTAMIMAAGLGTRMRPLTLTRPKPLVEVMGKPLIDHMVNHLLHFGVKKLCINVHYMADMLEAYIKARAAQSEARAEFIILDERALLLETGGGLMNAKPFLGEAPFICANSDSFWSQPDVPALEILADAWDDAKMDMLLLCVPHAQAHGYRGIGDFNRKSNGQLERKHPQNGADYIWTGVQIMHPRILVQPPSAAFSTNIFIDRAIAAGRCYGVQHNGLWFDVGTPEALPLVENLMRHG